MNSIDVYQDFACPYCYIGHHRIAAAVRLHGIDYSRIRYRAFQLNPDLPEAGIARAIYRERKFGSLQESRRRDTIAVAMAKKAGLTINFDQMELTPNTRRAHRAVKLAEVQKGDASALTARMLKAYFAEGGDIGNTDVLIALGAELDLALSHEQLNGHAADVDRTIDRDIAAARAVGLTGVPFVVSLDGNEAKSISVAAAVQALSEPVDQE